MKLGTKAIAIFFAIVGLTLLIGGAQLLFVGGSPFYLIAGLALLVSSLLLWMKKPVALWVIGLLFLATLIWSVWEVGTNFWGLVPRLSWILVIGILTAICAPYVLQGNGKKTSAAICIVLVIVSAIGIAQMFQVHGHIQNPISERNFATTGSGPGDDWLQYGKNSFGTRFVDSEQINPSNVKELQVAWTFRTGDVAGKGAEDQNTPLRVSDTVYVCTPYNKVIALDAVTGTEKWSYDPKVFGGDRKINQVRN